MLKSILLDLRRLSLRSLMRTRGLKTAAVAEQAYPVPTDRQLRAQVGSRLSFAICIDLQ